MQSTSPPWTVKETSLTTFWPIASSTVRPETVRVLSVSTGGFFCTVSSTGRPTIIEASSVLVDAGLASPTTLPRRMTVIRSAIARTSRSLWVMKTIAVPSSRSCCMIAMSSSVSCGVSTAVGSSNTSTFASCDSALMISTRCCTPTGRSSIFASGSTWKPKRCEISRTFCLAPASPPSAFSCPRSTFSATVKTGMSMKCWCTMPMPACIASPGPAKRCCTPSSRISPSSAW